MGVGIGAEVAGYRITRTIGEGGMSIVYLAERVLGGDQVALKILREELFEDEDLRRRFLRESRYAASLDHPGAVKVLDAGEVDGLLYIAMQYIEGKDLYALLAAGPLEASLAIAILGQVAAALDAAHAGGVLHRDVKPGNVLIASGGDERMPRCFLTDFGLSKHTTKDSVSLTQAGDFVGTIAYTAPEQMLGTPLDARVDVYSLGCVLFECLAGEPPFTGRDIEMMQAHIEAPPPKLSKTRSGFPPQLDSVFMKALAKEPDERYGSCGELLQAAAAALGVESPSTVAAAGGTLALLVAVGNSAGSLIRIADELTIGRGESGEGTLGDDPEISRRHARVSRAPQGGLTVEDLGSTNGTFVNGRQIGGPEILAPGDEIELGGTKLIVQALARDADPVQPVPPAARRALLRLKVDFAAGEGRIELEGGSAPIRLVHQGGRWRLTS